MARKLSPIARRIKHVLVAGATCLTAITWSARVEAQTADSPQVIDNPFTSAKPQPQAQPQQPAQPQPQAQSQPQPQPTLQSSPTTQTVAEPQQKVRRRTITYQNPFAAATKAPPVDTSLRPGPISRWRRPILPDPSPNSVKSALLATPAAEPTARSWDQLPPAEDLRSRIASRSPETDPTFYSRLSASPDSIQLAPKSLTQPSWLTQFDESAVRKPQAPQVHAAVVDAAVANTPATPTPVANAPVVSAPEVSTPVVSKPTVAKPVATMPAVDPVVIDEPAVNTPAADAPVSTPEYASQTSAQIPESHITRAEQVNRAFALDTLDTSSTKGEVSPSIIADCVDTSADWLAQAQHAAKDASTPEELSSIIEFCDRGLRIGPDEKLLGSLRKLSAWAYNRRGECLADADQVDQALNDFQAAISLDPTCSLAIHNRAVTFAQQNQFDAALRDFNRVIDLNPGLAVAYRNRAELLAAIGRMQEAVSDYNQALASLPNDAQLYRDRAYAYQHLGDFTKALADFNRAVEIAPDDPDTLTQRGNLAAEQSNYDQAVTDFQQALAKDPNWAEAHRSLAWLAATCSNPNFQNPHEAIAGAERAAKLAADNDYLILDTLAAAHASAGHFNKAANLQRQAIACAPPEITRALNQRLALYQNGQAFRNVAGVSGEQGEPAQTDVESNLPVGALR